MEIYWLEQDGSNLPPDRQWLSRAEMNTLQRLTVPKRRADWLLGRWTAKLAIAAHQHQATRPEALAAIEVRAETSGAPSAFIHGRPAPFPISLSHSGGTGFCAIGAAGADIGCDIEKMAPRSSRFVEDYFTAEEQDIVSRTPARGRDLVITLIWSAKESALKALHCGLGADTRSVTACPAVVASHQDMAWHPLTVSQRDGIAFHGWWREARSFTWTVVTARLQE